MDAETLDVIVNIYGDDCVCIWIDGREALRTSEAKASRLVKALLDGGIPVRGHWRDAGDRERKLDPRIADGKRT